MESQQDLDKAYFDQGKKYDCGKPRWDLIPFDAVEKIAEVMTWAIERESPAPYGEGSWKLVSPFRKRYISALMRHLTKYMLGHRYDDESGLLHTAHIATCAIFLVWGDMRDGKNNQIIEENK